MKFSKDDNIKIKEMISSGISRREIFDYIRDTYGLSTTRIYEIIKNNSVYSTNNKIIECVNILIDRMYNGSTDRIKLEAVRELNNCLILSHNRGNKKTIKANFKQNSYYMNKKSNGDLYFILNGDNIKIGKSKRVDGRIKELRRSYPDMVVLKVLKDCDKYEPVLHNIFRDYNIILDKGLQGHTEWFEYNDSIIDFISDVNESNIDLKIKNILNNENTKH